MATTGDNHHSVQIAKRLQLSFIVVDRPEKVIAKLDTYIAFHVTSEVCTYIFIL